MILLINPKKIKLKIKHCYLGLFEDVKSLVMMKPFVLPTMQSCQPEKNLVLEKEDQTFNLRPESIYIGIFEQPET